MEFLNNQDTKITKGICAAVNSYGKRKDAKPLDTVLKIENILIKYGIIPTPIWAMSDTAEDIAQNYAFAIRLSLNGIMRYGSFGKGTNLEYALASAYGELIERIQSCSLLQRIVGNDEVANYRCENEKILSLDEIANIKNSFMDNYFTKIFDKVFPEFDFPKFQTPKETINFLYENNILERDSYLCSNWYSYSEKKDIQFPEELLTHIFIGTNGCSSGNTNEEALVQAFSEIFERYAMSRILYEGLNPPDIPYEKYKDYPDIVNIIESYKKEGLELILKDASLGQGFPVVLLICVDKNTNKTTINFGSHPILPVAIERTLTETKQSNNIFRSIDSYPSDYFESFYFNKSMYCTSAYAFCAPFDLRILNKEVDWEFSNETWLNNSESNKELLKNIINFCEKKNFGIYIKNYSYLDFPCFRVYIPEISYIINHFEAKSIQNKICNDKSYIYNLLTGLSNNPPPLDFSEIERIYNFSISTFYVNQFLKGYEFIIAIIAFVSGYKIKKYENLDFIFRRIQFYMNSYNFNSPEFLNIIEPIRILLDSREFNTLAKFVDNLIEYCINYEKLRIENSNEDFIQQNPTFEEKNRNIELSKLQNSVIEILKYRQQRNLSNDELNGYFNSVMQ